MIGLGLSLCGSCVVADNDVVTEKPLYTQEHTRGYYIAHQTSALKGAGASSFALHTMADRALLSDVKQRAVVFTGNRDGKGTIFAVWTKDEEINGTCRNLYTNMLTSYASAFVQNQQKVWDTQRIYHFGVYDGTWDAQQVSYSWNDGENVFKRTVSVVELAGERNLLYRLFVNSGTQPSDAQFKMAYTKKRNEYLQLVYPLSSVRSDMSSVSINLINYQKVEL